MVWEALQTPYPAFQTSQIALRPSEWPSGLINNFLENKWGTENRRADQMTLERPLMFGFILYNDFLCNVLSSVRVLKSQCKHA